MKPQYILPTIILFLVASCTPDPSYRLLEYYSFHFTGNQGNRLLAGESKDIEVNYNIITNTNAPVDSVRTDFEVVTGGGTVIQEKAYVTSGETVNAIWQLGSDSFKQELKVSFYDLGGNYLTYLGQMAYGFRDNEWDGISAEPDNRIMDMVADTVNNFTLMISGGNLYRQGERYFLWEEVDDLIWEEGECRTIEIDSEGVIYVSTWEGEVYKSTDHGETWSECTKPYPDRNEYIYNYVSNDNDVWAFAHGYPIKRSKDNGLTWTVISGLEEAGFGDVFRLNNGNLLFHGSNCCSLYISDDDGLTWNHIPTPGLSVKLYVNDNDEIIIITQLGGGEFYLSTDYGETFTHVHHVGPGFSSSTSNIFTRWKDYYYVIVPQVGIYKTYDLVNYEDYWTNLSLVDLFIDHNGVLVAKDQDNETVYYRHNTD